MADTNTEEFVRVGSLAEIPEGELRAFDIASGRVCVAHASGEVYVFGDECTHRGCSLADEGGLIDAETVECGCHKGRFDVKTGEPTKGPPVDPVPVFRVRVADGWVEIGPPLQE